MTDLRVGQVVLYQGKQATVLEVADSRLAKCTSFQPHQHVALDFKTPTGGYSKWFCVAGIAGELYSVGVDVAVPTLEEYVKQCQAEESL